MARKKNEPPTPLRPLPFTPDLLDTLSDLSDTLTEQGPEFLSSTIQFEQALIGMAHTIAAQAVRVAEESDEAARIAAAHRQVELTGQLYNSLRSAAGLKDPD